MAIFHFLRAKSAIFLCQFPQIIIVSKLISKKMFSSRNCWNFCYCWMWISKCGKISLWKAWNSVLLRCIPQFLKKLESWLERLNTPLTPMIAVNWWQKFLVCWMLESSFQVLDDLTEQVKSSLMLELTSSLANIKTKRKFFAQKEFLCSLIPTSF